MSLPKIDAPIFTMNLTSIKDPIKYRPFLVKEEKLLLMAMEGGEQTEIVTTSKQIINNCILSENINAEELPLFDLQMALLYIRSKSVGEVIEVNLLAPDDGETSVPVEINVEDIKVQKSEDHTNKIQLDEKLVMEMKYPSLDEFVKNNFDFDENVGIDKSFELICSCIGKTYNEEEVWSSSDVTKKELISFLESMNSAQFKKIEKFFETMPKLSHSVTFTNPNTEKENTVVLEGLASFFD